VKKTATQPSDSKKRPRESTSPQNPGKGLNTPTKVSNDSLKETPKETPKQHPAKQHPAKQHPVTPRSPANHPGSWDVQDASFVGPSSPAEKVRSTPSHHWKVQDLGASSLSEKTKKPAKKSEGKPAHPIGKSVGEELNEHFYSGLDLTAGGSFGTEEDEVSSPSSDEEYEDQFLSEDEEAVSQPKPKKRKIESLKANGDTPVIVWDEVSRKSTEQPEPNHNGEKKKTQQKVQGEQFDFRGSFLLFSFLFFSFLFFFLFIIDTVF